MKNMECMFENYKITGICSCIMLGLFTFFLCLYTIIFKIHVYISLNINTCPIRFGWQCFMGFEIFWKNICIVNQDVCKCKEFFFHHVIFQNAWIVLIKCHQK